MTKDTLLHTIRSACGRDDVPVFFAEEGFSCMRDFLDHERSIGTTRYAMFLYHNRLLHSNKQFVTVSHANGVYMIEKAIPDEFIRVRDQAVTSRLRDVHRFFTKEFSMYDKTECDVCCVGIDHDLSTEMFNQTYRSCPRCFNVVCNLCVTRTALHTKSLACPFCKLS